jgi:hypothetical protein
VLAYATLTAFHFLPFWDDYGSVFEPIEKHDLDYFSGSESRLFFRPLEYYLNCWCLNHGCLWVIPLTSTALTAGAAILITAIALETTPTLPLRAWFMTASLVFAHPLILAGNFQFDTVSQASANFFSVAAMWAVCRKHISFTVLALVHLGGLASKESYFSFLVVSSICAFLGHWRRGNRTPAIAWNCVFVGMALAYLLMREHAINQDLLASTARYQFALGTNVLRNFAIFIMGAAYLGNTALAAQGLSAWMAMEVATTAFVWTSIIFLVRRNLLTSQGTQPLLSPDRERWSYFLIACASLLAASLPSVLAHDVSEQNASCFAMFAVGTLARYLARLCVNNDSVVSGPSCITLPRLVFSAAILCSTTAQLQKLAELRATSDENQHIMRQALAARGTGLIDVSCRANPKRDYSVYFMRSDVLAGHIESMLHTSERLAANDHVRCIASTN